VGVHALELAAQVLGGRVDPAPKLLRVLAGHGFLLPRGRPGGPNQLLVDTDTQVTVASCQLDDPGPIYGYYALPMASGDDEWFADESIWKDLYPFTFPESAFAVGDEQVEKILRLTGVGRGKVLDLCCGPGRHTVALAKRGVAVTAVDRTRFLLASLGNFRRRRRGSSQTVTSCSSGTKSSTIGRGPAIAGH